MFSDTHSGEPLEIKRFLAVLGLGLAIILIIERRLKKGQIKRLCKEVRLKHQELNEERNLRTEALERSYQKEQTLICTRRQYDEKLRKSDEDCKDSKKTLTAALLQIELLQEEFRLKDDELYYEQSLRIEATARRNQMERTLAFARKQYEETLRESNRECTRLSRQFEECSQNLSVTKAQVKNLQAEAVRYANEMERILTSTRQQYQERLRTSNQQCTQLRSQYDECSRTLSSTLAQVENLQAEAVRYANEMERILTSTRQQYQERLRTSNQQCTQLRSQYDECSRTLSSTLAQVESLNSELSEEQNSRNWIIPRDEIEISEKEIGRGAWGWVKEGTFRGTKVAIKQMHELIVSPHNRRLFEREMKMAARGRHPNLLLFIGATNDDNIALLVTELLDTNLRTVLGQRRLRLGEIFTLSLGVSRALNYLHMNKPHPITHRDISSANVLLFKREEAWHAKLSDYGSANFIKDLMTESPGATIYAAPEARTSTQSTKVDVYSFGLLLCEMCTRELPVPEQRNVQIKLITNDRLRELVQQCTNETPSDRPTMDNVVLTLQNLCPSRQ